MTIINGLYAMTPSHVAVAAQHLHNNVRPGKWLYQQSDETITPTLLATMIEKSVRRGGGGARLHFSAEDCLSGTSFEMLEDPHIMPMIVVISIDPSASKSDTTRFLFRLWHNAAFMRHTTIFVSASGPVDPILLSRMVMFGYQPEPEANAA